MHHTFGDKLLHYPHSTLRANQIVLPSHSQHGTADKDNATTTYIIVIFFLIFSILFIIIILIIIIIIQISCHFLLRFLHSNFDIRLLTCFIYFFFFLSLSNTLDPCLSNFIRCIVSPHRFAWTCLTQKLTAEQKILLLGFFVFITMQIRLVLLMTRSILYYVL